MGNHKNIKRKIRRALISVSDKSELIKILPTLKKFKVEIISSGGTFNYIRKHKFKCSEIRDFTGFQEILEYFLREIIKSILIK